jgi:hypothetical protein
VDVKRAVGADVDAGERGLVVGGIGVGKVGDGDEGVVVVNLGGAGAW